MSINPNKLNLNVREASEVLNVCPDIVYRLVKQGRIPSIHWCRKVLIPRAALEMQLREVRIGK